MITGAIIMAIGVLLGALLILIAMTTDIRDSSPKVTNVHGTTDGGYNVP